VKKVPGIIEIRFHGRGGQGAVTAAQLLAKAAFLEGKWSQAFPFFGAERRGAPVTAYTRISNKPILLRSQVYQPDHVVVLDPSLFAYVNPLSGLNEGGFVIVNTSKDPKDLNIPPNFAVATVDATSIALDLKLLLAGIPIVNTAMLGAIAKATNLVSVDSVEKVILKTWPDKRGEINARAVRLAYESTRIRPAIKS